MTNTNKIYSTQATDAYLGAIGYEGSNSRCGKYGAELAKVFRQEFKDNGIKGVSVKSNRGGYTDSFVFTFNVTDNDIISLDEYRNKSTEGWASPLDALLGFCRGWKWIPTANGVLFYERLFDLTNSESQRVLDYNIERKYNHIELYTHHDAPEYYTESFKNKVRLVKAIINSYNYDNSNSMVDYFDTGFYTSFKVKDCRTK